MQKDFRILPNDIDVEQAILGCCLIDVKSVSDVMEALDKDDFYREDHKLIFTAISNLVGKNKTVDILTVKDELSSMGCLENVGGLEYIATLSDKVTTTAMIGQYIDIVKENSTKRKLINASNEILKLGFDPTITAKELSEVAEKKVFEAIKQKNVKGVSLLKDLILASMDKLQDVMNNGVKKGIPTGFVDIDRRMGGLRGSELIILGARPRNG